MVKNKQEPSEDLTQREMQSAKEFLLMLVEERGGQITPQEVVDAAEDIQSPIHDYFEWDDKIAGVKYRRYQARGLINHFIVEHTKHQKLFHSIEVPIVKDGITKIERVYMTQEHVLSVADYRQQTLNYAIKQIKHWDEQYETFKELSRIHEAIETTMKELDAERQLRKMEVEDTEMKKQILH